MIKVTVKYKSDKLNGVKIKGHADYDDYGKDIVCASVSTMAITTVNNILTLDNDSCFYDTKDGLLDITIKEDSEIASKLLTSMINMLKDLASQYPNNIEIGGLK